MMTWTDPLSWLARHGPLARLTGRHPADAVERERTREAVHRARQVASEWQAAAVMQRALIWERDFWSRHGQSEGG